METKLFLNGYKPFPFSSFKFSGGETQVRLLLDSAPVYCPSKDNITIFASITSSDKLMEVFLLTDALRNIGFKTIFLTCPYLPYARQDRVCFNGEALSLKVIAKLINAQNYDSVLVWDVHSNVALALIDNVTNITADILLSSFHKPIVANDVTIIAPDHGALVRASSVAKQFNLPMIVANKVRDPNTGEITKTEIKLTDSYNYLIVDDICDGGRTFIELAKEIRNQLNILKIIPKIDLYVTHGIFSKGFEVFNGLIDDIYVANCFVDNVPANVYVLEGY